MNELLTRSVPPGVDHRPLVLWFWIGNAAATVLSLGTFLYRYLDARKALYEYVDGRWHRIADARIDAFAPLASGTTLFFLTVALSILAFALSYALYYRQGSMSIYLMKMHW